MEPRPNRLKHLIFKFLSSDPKFWEMLDRNSVLYGEKNLLSKYWT